MEGMMESWLQPIFNLVIGLACFLFIAWMFSQVFKAKETRTLLKMQINLLILIAKKAGANDEEVQEIIDKLYKKK